MRKLTRQEIRAADAELEDQLNSWGKYADWWWKQVDMPFPESAEQDYWLELSYWDKHRKWYFHEEIASSFSVVELAQLKAKGIDIGDWIKKHVARSS